MSNIRKQIQEALRKNLLILKPQVKMREDYPCYLSDHKDNLLEGVTADMWSQIIEELGGGSGGELKARLWKRRNVSKPIPPKFDAVYSSSALAINTFAPIPVNSLKLCGQSGFQEMRFEKKLNTGFRGVPNLDLFLKNDTHVIACESKFLEYLEPSEQEIQSCYNHDKFPLANDPQWLKASKDYNGQNTNIPAAQLVKHYFGIKSDKEKDTFAGRKVILLYLFWEPVNATDDVFKVHRQEIKTFAEQVNNSSVEFRYMSYPELWNEWERLGYKAHVEKLRKRYLVTV